MLREHTNGSYWLDSDLTATSDIRLKSRHLRKFRPKRSIRAHAAVAPYLVLGGTAEWRRGAEPWARRPPGAFILHPSRIEKQISMSVAKLNRR